MSHLITCLQSLGFEHLIDDRIFAVRRKDRCRSLFKDLNGMIPVKTLDELKMA